MNRSTRWLFVVSVSSCFLPAGAFAANAPSKMEAEWQSTIQPLLRTFCFDCHSEQQAEADIDLSEFDNLTAIRKNVKTWIKIRQMLNTNQMPPKDSDQPSTAQSQQLQSWVNRFLIAEAESRAGDPGPVMLRRLNNAEYDYTVQDLTGIASLHPTAEFPVDGAAGEGFTNTGSAQSMSPSLVSKYLDAAKSLADHTVFLPDGLRFSAHTSRRDQSDELVAKIQAFYRQFSQASDETAVNFDGVTYRSIQEGWLPVELYIPVTIKERAALETGSKTIDEVALKYGLNTKYLTKLWSTLTQTAPNSPSPLLDQLRRKWKQSSVSDVAELIAEVKQAQQILWKFNAIGQYGGEGTQKRWMEAVSPILTTQEFRVALPPTKPGHPSKIYLSTKAAPGSDSHSVAIWKQPRLEFAPDATGYQAPSIPLRDLSQSIGRVQRLMKSELPRTAEYLQAVAVIKSSQQPVAEVASSQSLNVDLLSRWRDLANLDTPGSREISGHYNTLIKTSFGNDAIKGWGTSSTPSLLTNPTNEDVRFRTLTIPARSITVHPSPVEDSIIAWRSPFTGEIHIKGRIVDVDRNNGNGINWNLNLNQASGTVGLADGTLTNGESADFSVDSKLSVSEGDLVSLIVDARDANHICDTTHVELKFSEHGGEKRVWNLADDVVEDIHKANPRADSYGNESTWHFASREHKPQVKSPIPSGSAFAIWRAAVLNNRPAGEVMPFAISVQESILETDAAAMIAADQKLRTLVQNWKGPLRWTEITTSSNAASSSEFGIPPERFGQHPSGHAIDASSLATTVPQLTTITIPAELAPGATFVTNGELPKDASPTTCLQLQVSIVQPTDSEISAASPFLAQPETDAWQRMDAAMHEYRDLFPKALSYSRIVPVDEVVTMALYFREDDHLQRLMLNDNQVAELDRLWDELFYVAQEPIALTVVYEQIYEFATQDRQDLVEAFAPMRGPINARADVFRERLLQTQPAHLDAVIEFAGRAWRRTPLESEQAAIRNLYQELRDSEIPHENALRLVIAKTLTSPAFLYRGEQPGPTQDATLVSSAEMGSRLSYFLWSSVPDIELRRVADSGSLNTAAELTRQTQRMLSDEKVRRLAIHFACQWMHLRDFDQNDDKNEHLYPEFASIRKDMYEETVRFFEDMFRTNGSILDILNADHTFLNDALAQHYGIDNIKGPEWRRVDDVRGQGRGGVLGMATLLASQSGASRTSPILRGNWIYETLLGERLPRPPANVPQLPEALPEGLTARQLIEKHTSVEACAKCHIRIDPYGFALEQYDAIGRLRPTTADTHTVLQNGNAIEGIEGLRQYLLTDRRDDVVRQFCRKLLGFALGRETQLSDELLLTHMLKQLEANEYRFSTAVEAIVLSDQFRKIRGRKYVDSVAGR